MHELTVDLNGVSSEVLDNWGNILEVARTDQESDESYRHRLWAELVNGPKVRNIAVRIAPEKHNFKMEIKV